jgi:hypothetical protein
MTATISIAEQSSLTRFVPHIVMGRPRIMSEPLTRKHPRVLHLKAGAVLALLLSWMRPAPAAHATACWGTVQSHLEAFDGKPLVAANWSGRYRPYVFDGERYVAVIVDEPSELARFDLTTPFAISATEILLSGSEAGRPEYDIFAYDTQTKTLRNLTATPNVDEGRICVNHEARLIAFRARPGPSANASQPAVPLRDEQRVARVADGLQQIGEGGLPPFDDCVWLDAETLLGIERRTTGYQLQRCSVTTSDVRCEARAALAGIDAVTGFLEPEGRDVGIIARRGGDSFRRPYVLSEPFDTLVPAPLPPGIRGDVLDRQGDVLRVSLESRYTSSLAPQSGATVYATRKFGTATFAIVATERMPRTLARLKGAEWEIVRHPSVAMPDTVALPAEIWLGARSERRYQAWEFGDPKSDRVVVWWHGGPHESVSPRFNPYFQRLHELGFRVLAVNYPGSTGRGVAYEKSFNAGALAECVSAVWDYLRGSGARAIVSWSISSGSAVQQVVLRQRVPVSALVDQSGWGPSTLVRDTKQRSIPFFAIRGRNDPYGPIEHVDYSYAGGHDLTVAEDFATLFEAIAPFLAGAPRIDWSDAREPARPPPVRKSN